MVHLKKRKINEEDEELIKNEIRENLVILESLKKRDYQNENFILLKNIFSEIENNQNIKDIQKDYHNELKSLIYSFYTKEDCENLEEEDDNLTIDPSKTITQTLTTTKAQQPSPSPLNTNININSNDSSSTTTKGGEDDNREPDIVTKYILSLLSNYSLSEIENRAKQIPNYNNTTDVDDEFLIDKEQLIKYCESIQNNSSRPDRNTSTSSDIKETNEPKNNNNNSKMYIGIGGGAIIIVLLAILLIFFFVLKKKRNNETTKYQDNTNKTDFSTINEVKENSQKNEDFRRNLNEMTQNNNIVVANGLVNKNENDIVNSPNMSNNNNNNSGDRVVNPNVNPNLYDLYQQPPLQQQQQQPLPLPPQILQQQQQLFISPILSSQYMPMPSLPRQLSPNGMPMEMVQSSQMPMNVNNYNIINGHSTSPSIHSPPQLQLNQSSNNASTISPLNPSLSPVILPPPNYLENNLNNMDSKMSTSSRSNSEILKQKESDNESSNGSVDSPPSYFKTIQQQQVDGNNMKKVYTSYYYYNADLKDEMQISKGDLIYFDNVTYDDGWAYGTNITKKIKGIFPLGVLIKNEKSNGEKFKARKRTTSSTVKYLASTSEHEPKYEKNSLELSYLIGKITKEEYNYISSLKTKEK